MRLPLVSAWLDRRWVRRWDEENKRALARLEHQQRMSRWLTDRKSAYLANYTQIIREEMRS